MACRGRPQECLTDHVLPFLASPRLGQDGQYYATCPSCGGNLSLKTGDKARLLLTCWHQPACTLEQIVAAMPPQARGCLPRSGGRHRKRVPDKELAAIEELLSADYLSPAALRIRMAALLWQMPPADAAAKLGYSERTWRRIRSENPGRARYK